MSVGFPETAIEAKMTVTHEFCVCGMLFGDDSDMNEATVIAASNDSYFTNRPRATYQ